MEENKQTKKTLGRRKIEIKKISKKSSLQVTFTKRRMGLFRKASELSVLCGAEIAILVQSPADKVFAFGHPSVDALVDRLRATTEPAAASSWLCRADDGRSEYEEAMRKLEAEKRALNEEAGREFWWDQSMEGMELHELEEYVEAMEGLKDKLHELEVKTPAPPENWSALVSPELTTGTVSPELTSGTVVSDLTGGYDNYPITFDQGEQEFNWLEDFNWFQ